MRIVYQATQSASAWADYFSSLADGDARRRQRRNRVLKVVFFLSLAIIPAGFLVLYVLGFSFWTHVEAPPIVAGCVFGAGVTYWLIDNNTTEAPRTFTELLHPVFRELWPQFDQSAGITLALDLRDSDRKSCRVRQTDEAWYYYQEWLKGKATLPDGRIISWKGWDTPVTWFTRVHTVEHKGVSASTKYIGNFEIQSSTGEKLATLRGESKLYPHCIDRGELQAAFRAVIEGDAAHTTEASRKAEQNSEEDHRASQRFFDERRYRVNSSERRQLEGIVHDQLHAELIGDPSWTPGLTLVRRGEYKYRSGVLLKTPNEGCAVIFLDNQEKATDFEVIEPGAVNGILRAFD